MNPFHRRFIREVSFTFILAALSGSFALADIPVMTIQEVFTAGKNYSPDLKVSHSREQEAQKKVAISKSDYLPDIQIEAVDSTGFPGSSGALGLTGVMGSPFRSGLSGGVVLTQDLYDFGRTSNGVKAAESDARSQRHATEIDRYNIEKQLIQAYLDCALNRAQLETWQDLQRETDLVARETERYVVTGQRSIVDRYLSRAQKQQANTNTLDYQAREEVSLSRLKLLIGTNSQFQCPSFDVDHAIFELQPSKAQESPFVQLAQTELESAQARMSQTQSENLPKLVGIASTGYLEGAHVVDVQNYSLGVGLVIPVFEGFRIKNSIDERSAQVDEKDYLLQSSRLAVQNYNEQYDERIQSSQVRVQSLVGELENADRAFDVAKKRYFNFQGNLIDVRDALSNLSRVKTDLNTARSTLIEFSLLKSILNNPQ